MIECTKGWRKEGEDVVTEEVVIHKRGGGKETLLEEKSERVKEGMDEGRCEETGKERGRRDGDGQSFISFARMPVGLFMIMVI